MLALIAKFNIWICLLASSSCLLASVVPNIDQPQKIGVGFDINNQAFRNSCLTGDVEYAGAQVAEVNFESSLDEDDLIIQLNTSIKGKVNLFVASASASLKMSRFLRKRDYSLNLIYSHHLTGKSALIKNIALTAQGQKAIASNDVGYKELLCGQEFVHKINLGASLFIAVRLDFASEEMKEEWKAKVKFKVFGFKKTKTFRGSSGYENASTSVSFHAVQVGGNPEKLDEVLATINKMKCTLAQIEQCYEAIDKLFDYATSDSGFPAQVSELRYDPNAYYPAVSYETKPYNITEFAAISDPDFLPFSLDVQGVQESVSDEYEYMANIELRARELLDSDRLLPEERPAVQKILEDSHSNTVNLLRIRDICLKNTEAICLASFADLALLPVDASKLSIPDRIMDRCIEADFGSSVDSDARIIQYIYDHYPINSCEDLERQKSLVKTIALDEKNISSIAILKHFTSIEHLSFSDNEISSLSALRFHPNLDYLNIAHNEVHDLNPLRFRNKLEFLNLASNSIESLGPINDLRPKKIFTYSNPMKDYGRIPDQRGLYELLIMTSHEACTYELGQALQLGFIDHDDYDFYYEMGFGPTYVNPLDRSEGVDGFYFCDIAVSQYDYR